MYFESWDTLHVLDLTLRPQVNIISNYRELTDLPQVVAPPEVIHEVSAIPFGEEASDEEDS